MCETYTDLFSQHFSFWEHLSETEQQSLCNHTNVTSFSKGSTIHSPGEECIGILLVKKGHLRVYMLSEDGRDITLYRLFPGDVCILSASCVLEAITFDVLIDAEEDTDVLQISAAAFRQLAEQNIYVKAFGYELTTDRFSDVMWAMQQILFMSADRRLAIFLLDEMTKTGNNEIRLTHEQIARYMGSAREVVSRMLKYFAQEGIVILFRGGLQIIDKEKLKKLALPNH